MSNTRRGFLGGLGAFLGMSAVGGSEAIREAPDTVAFNMPSPDDLIATFSSGEGFFENILQDENLPLAAEAVDDAQKLG